MKCKNCGQEVSDSTTNCTSCGEWAGFCNVRIAENPQEVQALLVRYGDAVTQAKTRGVLPLIESFESMVAKDSRAVVALDVDRLWGMAKSPNTLFTNYQLLVDAFARKPAALEHDKRRTRVDGALFGSFGKNIRYAVLSLDKTGLKSYGNCFIVLKELHTANRASVLECNSFDFVENSQGRAQTLGYRSTWSNRHLLAVAKCVNDIDSNTQSADFSRIILKAGDNRQEDDFLEVHIYGPFDFKAIEAIGVAKVPFDTRDSLTLDLIKKYAKDEDIEWLAA
jgi:hypothetical protein